MDPHSRAEHLVAALIAAIAIVAVIAAATACLRQADGLRLLTEDVAWLQFATA